MSKSKVQLNSLKAWLSGWSRDYFRANAPRYRELYRSKRVLKYYYLHELYYDIYDYGVMIYTYIK